MYVITICVVLSTFSCCVWRCVGLWTMHIKQGIVVCNIRVPRVTSRRLRLGNCWRQSSVPWHFATHFDVAAASAQYILHNASSLVRIIVRGACLARPRMQLLAR